MAWLWLAVLILSVVCDVVTKKNIFISFVPSALICCVIDFFFNQPWVQAGIFVCVSVVSALIYKFVIVKKFNSRGSVYSLDSLVGERCVVVEKVDNFAGCGLVKVGKQFWSARGAFEEDSFDVGEALIIVAIEGVKVICKKI